MESFADSIVYVNTDEKLTVGKISKRELQELARKKADELLREVSPETEEVQW